MSPRFKKVAACAVKTLVEHNLKSLPIDPFMLVKKHKNWKTMTYIEFGNLNNLDEEEVIFQIGSIDGCAFYDVAKDRYLIIYNNNPLWIDTPKRITWTIMHEIGHILLGHLEETGESMITRAALGEEKYKTFEAEAEYFAACVLAPFPVIYRLKLFTWEQIMNICCISKTASQNRLKHIQWRIKQKRFFKDDYIIDNLFHDFIHQKMCNNCNFGLVHKEAKFCPVCGDKLIWGEGKMIYDGHTLDENSKAVICPKCGNEEIIEHGDYCMVCGAYLINKCADKMGENDFGNYVVLQKSCEANLPGNARYCYICGNPSTYLLNGLLEPWEKVKAQQENEASQNEAVTAETEYQFQEINFSEEELPF